MCYKAMKSLEIDISIANAEKYENKITGSHGVHPMMVSQILMKSTFFLFFNWIVYVSTFECK